MKDQTSSEFFEAKYQQESDPWQFASSAYEQARYAAMIEALGDRRFKRAIEPGCSIGVLTELLSRIADKVEASDFSPTAVKQAQKRCEHLANVHISVAPMTAEMVSGFFDLLVLSEIGYYFNEEDLMTTVKGLSHHLERDGILLAGHWLGSSPDHILTGDRVHKLLGEVTGMLHEHGQRNDGFRLDVWRRW